MNVSGVNSVSFKGKISETKKGNQYEKTNISKKIGLIFVGCEVAINSVRLSCSKTETPKAILARKWARLMLIETVLAVGIGAIIDGLINRSRRKKVDKAAALETKIDKKVEAKLAEILDTKS